MILSLNSAVSFNIQRFIYILHILRN